MKTSTLSLKKLLNDDSRRIVVYTYLCGLAAHGVMMFNKLSWYSDLARGLHSTDTKKLIAMGRWMRMLIAKLIDRGFGGISPSLPLFHGLVCLFLIATSACLIARIFDIREKPMQFALSGLMVTFPVVTSTFAFMFTAPHYLFALFLAVAAVYAASGRMGPVRFLIGTACLFCSLGIYQSYFPVAVSLFVVLLILRIAEGRLDTFSAILKTGLYYLGICVCGIGVYFVIWKVTQKLFGDPVTSYQGISTMGTSKLGYYWKAIVTTYKRFLLRFDDGRENVYPLGLGVVQKGIIGLSAIGAICLVIRQLRKKPVTGIVMALLIAILPLCFNLVYVMAAVSPDSDIHTVMLYGQAVLYVFLICCVRLICGDGKKAAAVFRRVAIAALVLMVAVNAYFDNACYLKAEMVQEQTISNMTVLVSRIKSTEGYKDTMPVCFTMNAKRDATYETNSALSEIQIFPFRTIFNRHDPRSVSTVLKYWCGFSPKIVSAKKFKKLEEVVNMPDYPDDGSIRIIDDTVVVKW